MIILGLLGGILVTWFLAGSVLAGVWTILASEPKDKIVGVAVIAIASVIWWFLVGVHINWDGLIE